MLGAGSATAIVMFGFRYTNGITGYKTLNDAGLDEVEEKEAYKRTYRRPLSETIEQLGEGRGKFDANRRIQSMLSILGIYAPGYEERRRERLLARYGIDVGAAQGSKV